ncbi:Regulatory protein cys-3 [Phlyctema vagabunda]|uniref:Regulatory protein cys-3 n=1 Tax=Phlyctema vagabunda TaxID=108571 RepID=A0ABR4PHT1_9HELO
MGGQQRSTFTDRLALPLKEFTSLEVPQVQGQVQDEQQQHQRQRQRQHRPSPIDDRDLQEPNWDLLDYVPLQNYDMNSHHHHHHQAQHPQYYPGPPPPPTASSGPSPAEDAAAVAAAASYHHFQTQPHPSPTYPFSPSASTSPYSQQQLAVPPPSSFASPGAGNPYEALTVQEAELKRLRNTAASARFRAKKKQREASLERNAREKREQLEKLEERISQLEKENQWLRELILRKGDRIEEGKKKGEERKDGVGTESEAKE